MNPIQFSLDNTGCSVTYIAPSRKFGNLREELNKDALLINKELGPVYVGFSSGLDSQVILRCFLDMNCDFIPFFVHIEGKNDFEHEMVLQSEKFYGIDVEKHKLRLEDYQDKWLAHSKEHNIPTCLHYPLVHVISNLSEKFPIITSGANEPCFVGTTKSVVSIYHNYHEPMRLRFNQIQEVRDVFDFPYTSESLASYYCDDILKTYAITSQYFKNNNLAYVDTNALLPSSDYFNIYVKPFVKGKHFGKDILYPSKKTGFELFPPELLGDRTRPKNSRVSVNYDQLVEHLEKCDGSSKTFSSWDYPDY